MWLVIAALAFGAQADTVRNPLTNNPSAAVAGRRLYDQACQSCHGSAGQGDRGPALNGSTFTYGGADAHLFHKLTRTDVRVAARGASFDRLVHADAEPQNWFVYWGNFQGTHYSALKEIDSANVSQLRVAWTFPMPGDSVLEATPLVVDGVMYTTQPGMVVALDARTGRQIWRYARSQKVRSPYEINPFNRGAAILGNRLFVGTLDAALVALDIGTGLPLWETQVADPMLGRSLTSAPLVVKDKELVGITGGECGALGFLDAYDA